MQTELTLNQIISSGPLQFHHPPARQSSLKFLRPQLNTVNIVTVRRIFLNANLIVSEPSEGSPMVFGFSLNLFTWWRGALVLWSGLIANHGPLPSPALLLPALPSPGPPFSRPSATPYCRLQSLRSDHAVPLVPAPIAPAPLHQRIIHSIVITDLLPLRFPHLH